MQNPRILACVVAALGSLTAAGCGSSNDCDDDNKDCNGNGNGSGVAVVRVENQSGFAIKEVHVASVGSTAFGANLVSSSVLASGGSATLAVPCGRYDMQLIDAAGQQCILHDVDLCANNGDFTIASAVCSTFTNQDP